eukprot:TRINITY_DN71708_c0_g1_i1.p1 TRINITY_DN71708_c0_g1~~TRINITY_DN71708_c0_g1_i1.p1  ORF type:complete len:446 (-),score=61.45 TRINITY_DN71708_c0_g1_i1:41-1378(-)
MASAAVSCAAGSPSGSLGCCDAAALPLKGCPREEHGVEWSVVLAAMCAHCTAFATCTAEQGLLRLVEHVWQVSQRVAFTCMRGLFAAAVVRAQFQSTTFATGFNASFLGESEESGLLPFPFMASQHELFSSMVPARDAFCNEQEIAEYGNRRFLPRADHQRSGCAIQRTETQLLRACRSRRAGSDIFADILSPSDLAALRGSSAESGVSRSGLEERVRRFRALTCPSADSARSAVQSLRDMLKYEERVASGGCHSGGGVWGADWIDSHKCTLVVAAERLGFRPGHLLLDWGSGCGHSLSWAKALYDVDGIGVEAVPAVAQWASRFSLGRTCAADGRALEWLPDGLFDYVFSYAALLHLQTQEQCRVAIQLVRKLRVGGRALLGWNRAHLTSPWMWQECFDAAVSIVTVELEVIEDWLLYPMDRDGAMNNFLWKYPSYTITLSRIS